MGWGVCVSVVLQYALIISAVILSFWHSWEMHLHWRELMRFPPFSDYLKMCYFPCFRQSHPSGSTKSKQLFTDCLKPFCMHRSHNLFSSLLIWVKGWTTCMDIKETIWLDCKAQLCARSSRAIFLLRVNG